MEIWKDMVGYSNYQASNWGRIRSKRGRILKTRDDGRGYRRINLIGDKKGHTTVRVHRLVCEAFHGPCPDGMEVLHADDMKTNNHASNLSWGTRQQNIGKLTETCVHMILAMLAAGHRAVDIADRFGVGTGYVYKLKRGEKMKHLPRPYTLHHA